MVAAEVTLSSRGRVAACRCWTRSRSVSRVDDYADANTDAMLALTGRPCLAVPIAVIIAMMTLTS